MKLCRENLHHHIMLVNASTMSKCGCPAVNWMMTKQKQWLCPLRECPRPYPCQILIQSVLQMSCFFQSAKTLDVMLDTHLTMKNQVINPVRTANFELWCINTIRHYLSVEATQKLVLAFLMYRLDYFNSLLYGCPQYLINRLQKVQKMLCASSWRFLKLTILRHTYKLYTGFQ